MGLLIRPEPSRNPMRIKDPRRICLGNGYLKYDAGLIVFTPATMGDFLSLNPDDYEASFYGQKVSLFCEVPE